MIRLVSWNIFKRWQPWRQLAEMARQGEVDVALLQEAGSPSGDLVDTVQYEDDVLWEAASLRPLSGIQSVLRMRKKNKPPRWQEGVSSTMSSCLPTRR